MTLSVGAWLLWLFGEIGVCEPPSAPPGEPANIVCHYRSKVYISEEFRTREECEWKLQRRWQRERGWPSGAWIKDAPSIEAFGYCAPEER